MISLKTILLAIFTIAIIGLADAAMSQTMIESGLLGKEVAGSVGDKLKNDLSDVIDSALSSEPRMVLTDSDLPSSPVIKIMNIIRAYPNYTTFVHALKMTGLDTLLDQVGPFTVFVPDDSAWAKISKSDLDAMMKNPSQLASLLKYHILPGYYSSSNLNKLIFVGADSSENIALPSIGGTVVVSGLQITNTDTRASNGVIHQIKAVLTPLNQGDTKDKK